MGEEEENRRLAAKPFSSFSELEDLRPRLFFQNGPHNRPRKLAGCHLSNHKCRIKKEKERFLRNLKLPPGVSKRSPIQALPCFTDRTRTGNFHHGRVATSNFCNQLVARLEKCHFGAPTRRSPEKCFGVNRVKLHSG